MAELSQSSQQTRLSGSKISRGWNVFRARLAALRKRRLRGLAERLGYGPSARLVIVHADDLGLAQAVNSAFISGVKTGLISSGSAIVPARCFAEIAAFARTNPEADIGLHLTLTSESVTDGWAPIASPMQVPSLINGSRQLLENWTPETRISSRELEIELRAQIDKAYAAGLHPTHLDSHRYLLLSRRDVFEVYVRLAREYDLPALISREWLSRIPYLQPLLSRRDVVLDRVVIIQGNVSPQQWPAFYQRALARIPPGVTEFLIHPGYDNEELRAFFGNQAEWGAAWRQRDFDFFTSEEFRALLAKNAIELTTWREIASRLR